MVDCGSYYSMYPDLKERIISHLSSRKNLSFDELRDLLEDEGIYMDGRCLRKYIASLVREGAIVKKPDRERNKLLLSLPDIY